MRFYSCIISRNGKTPDDTSKETVTANQFQETNTATAHQQHAFLCLTTNFIEFNQAHIDNDDTLKETSIDNQAQEMNTIITRCHLHASSICQGFQSS